MKKFAKEELAPIPERNGLKAKEVSLKALEEKGLGIVSYGVQKGEVIEFPDTEEDATVWARPVRENGPEEMLVAVKRNDKPSWFSIGGLRRMDYQGKPVGPVCEDLRSCSNDYERVKRMLGKKITANETTEIQVYHFDNGVRTTDLEPRMVPVLVYA